MSSIRLSPVWLGAAAALGGGAALAWRVGSGVLAGCLAGAGWNLASLWCLVRLLGAWLGPQPSRRRALGWAVMKFPLLYGLAILILRAPSVSLTGFGAGFTAVLIGAIGWFALRAQHLLVARPHGR